MIKQKRATKRLDSSIAEKRRKMYSFHHPRQKNDDKARASNRHFRIKCRRRDDDATVARLFLSKKTTDNVQKAIKLLKKLAFLLLTIVQAAAYINVNQITLTKYLKLLTEQKKDVMNLLNKSFENENRYNEDRNNDMKNSIATT